MCEVTRRVKEESQVTEEEDEVYETGWDDGKTEGWTIKELGRPEKKKSVIWKTGAFGRSSPRAIVGRS